MAAPRLMKVGDSRLLRPIAHAAINLRRFFRVSGSRCSVYSHARAWGVCDKATVLLQHLNP
jgi:hypothetical protein